MCVRGAANTAPLPARYCRPPLYDNPPLPGNVTPVLPNARRQFKGYFHCKFILNSFDAISELISINCESKMV